MQTKHIFQINWLLSAAFALLLALPLSAQKVAEKPEKQPEYPGGMPALIDYMVTNIKYPETAKKDGAAGVVMVNFLIGKDGSISKIKTVAKGSQNPREDFVMESIRVIKGMPKWVPAQSKGKSVSAEVTLPIKFALDDKKP